MDFYKYSNMYSLMGMTPAPYGMYYYQLMQNPNYYQYLMEEYKRIQENLNESYQEAKGEIEAEV